MPKHYSQKEAFAMIDKINHYEETMNIFFDKYNDIRSQAKTFVDGEFGVSETIVSSMKNERAIVDQEMKKEIDLIFPEFLSTRDEYFKQLGRREAFRDMKIEFSKYFFKKTNKEN